MIYVTLKGGLGNQLFQYAAGLYLSNKFHNPLVLSTHYYNNHNDRTYELNKVLDLGNTIISSETPQKPNIYNRVFDKLKPKHKRFYFCENSSSSFDEFKRLNCPIWLDGYWQYFELAAYLKQQNQLKFTIKNANFVAVHFRGGDYINNEHHSLLDETYYKAAFEYQLKQNPNAEFYIFSDTPKLFQFNFLENYNHQWMLTKKGYIDFKTLLGYNAYIIANSTFSWWPAFLSNPAHVVAPKIWLKNDYKAHQLVEKTAWKLI